MPEYTAADCAQVWEIMAWPHAPEHPRSVQFVADLNKARADPDAFRALFGQLSTVDMVNVVRELCRLDVTAAIKARERETIASLKVGSGGLEQLKTRCVDTTEPHLRRPLTPWPSEAGIPILVDETVPEGEVWAFDKDGKRVTVLRIGSDPI